MHRRRFLLSSLAASTIPLSAQAPATLSQPQQFYQLRAYRLQSGPQTALTEAFFADALIPALNRLGLTPIGAFRLDIGPETPTLYLLIPATSLDLLAQLDQRLTEDAAFLTHAAPFWAAPATAPAFRRVESSLLTAFPGWPRLSPPPSAATHTPRIFQLRTYESPSPAAHIRKMEMFHHGEFDLFQRTGLHPVFFADTLIGPRQPALTYMLTFADMAELTRNWATFSADPAWKKLKSDPRYAYEEIVSNITNLILSPLPCSQI